MKKVLFLLLDAFRGDYINEVDTPFLYAKSRTGVFSPKLRSVAGFTQRTAIYTGTTGDATGMFTMFTFDAENSPFRFLRGDDRVRVFESNNHWWNGIPRFRGSDLLKRTIAELCFGRRKRKFTDWIQSESKKYANHAPIVHIPLTLLTEIGVSEDNRPIHLPGALEIESIFDVFTEAGVAYDYAMYPIISVQDDDVLDRIVSQRNGPARVILGQLADSDYFVHHCGPSSPKRRKIIAEIDRKLREIDAHYGNEATWIVIGDHGMTDVTEEINVQEVVAAMAQRSGVLVGKDFLVFLDSTMARFKWLTDAGEEFVLGLKHVDAFKTKGRFLDKKLAESHAIPIEDKRYGDLIWWANVGVLIFPDYFHDLKTHNKGMHGYDSDHDDMKGFFLAFGPGIAARRLEQVNLIDVCPSICKAAGVYPPKSNKGKCLI